MPAGSAAVPALISFADVSACTDVPSIFALFRKLRYPVEHPPIAVPLDESDLPGSLRDAIAARYPIAHIGGARLGELALDVTLILLRQREQASAGLRSIAQTWTRRFPGWHLLVFAVATEAETGGFRRLTFVNARRLGEGAEVRIKLHKLIVDRLRPTRHDLDTLNRLAVASSTTAPAALYTAQCSAFDVERMTNEFYREYARRFRAAQERIKQDNRGIAALFYEPAPLHTFTQRLFGRLMFLYFLQKKGALNGNPGFVSEWYDRAVRDDENFYQAVLEPLFFDTLNRPRDSGHSSRFGRVPYLNGGLFAADDDDHVGAVLLENDLFDAHSPDGLLYFLDTHNFTIEEDTPLEVEVALDPEMLGKVFENLLEADERGQSGTFYTPRPVVAFMCREALASYLGSANIDGLDEPRLGWLLDEAETGEPARDEQGAERLTNATVPRAPREHIERALEAVRVLDPAVGSGAFPLGMLALLVGVRRALYRIAGAEVAPQSHLVEGWKRNFIRDCLYGVDIKQEAIEIARLRLWLSLVVDADPFDMEPLPNLDYKLMAGDSLIETFEGVAIYPTRPAATEAIAQQALMRRDEVHQLILKLHEQQSQYFQPDARATREDLKQGIRVTEAGIVRQALSDRKADEETRLQRLVDQLAKLQGKPVPAALTAEQQALTHSIAMTDQTLADLKAGKPLPFFLYRLHFASVFEEKQGFDIVIANPPYVRHEKIAPTTLAALKTAYPGVAHGMADLYVYFYARALQLLRDGGALCFITSNKFFDAGYGIGLRQVISRKTSVRMVIDFGHARVFDASTYPCIVTATKGAPDTAHWYLSLTAGQDINLDRLTETVTQEGQRLPQASGVHPAINTASTSNLVERLLSLGTPLKSYTSGRLYYGLKTGLNDVFVIKQAAYEEFIAVTPASKLILKPFLRGRDLGRYSIRPSGHWLICCENGWTRAAMKVGATVSEKLAWDYFNDRFPAIAAYLMPLAERARNRDDQGQYWWEMRPCTYYAELSGAKVISTRFGVQASFSFDDHGYYCNNATSFFAPSKPWLAGILNSSVCDLCLTSICPRVQNGYSQFFMSNIEQLPIVEPALPDKQRLEQLVDQIQAAGGRGSQAEALEREVDEIVYRTYGLSRDEIAEIERWHEERRALLGKGGRGGPEIQDPEE